ncbi:MarR family transcriptional regulator [Agrobacterium vitis]|uniref:MarR family transcriptional regulator n=1 Tax=Agrobacterium vitis TaxID=373 RepID=A0AAE4WBX8_AGRVI|nr:MarR family transcriptional regulator [Agrobacterium vitis]MCF1499371.1 MarR family transcriptional regulator [Allorhizobium sp. Av2]MCM2439377.1 MarR family transcriptional regulator [Agrobacterium vitis]MUZ57719.1 MarR family transcriptional regulator [Agrobacterium vitis]MVA68194.1 MarR family transcriptional regulator [Agrobacterium vitis]MVA87782.1 MarR family transcriptional regulator [Agrobacterium vitis]
MLFDRRQSPTYLVSQLAKEFARALQVRAEGLGFSAGQFPILLELWEEQGLTQKQLLERVAVEQATMANTLSRMERDGLIERKPHPTDRRAQLVFLTAKGDGLRDQAISAACEADEALFQGFRRFEKELMLEFIRQALENARSRENGPNI